VWTWHGVCVAAATIMNTHLKPSLLRALLVGLLTVACGGEERASFGPGTGGSEPSVEGSSGGAAGTSAHDAAPLAQDDQESSTSDPGDEDPEQTDQEDAGHAPDPDGAGDPHPTTHTHCGWNGVAWYFCDNVGDDPSGQFPIDCPAGLVAGGACGTLGSEGCCDDEDRNWFCTPDGKLVVLDCR
jgi:hypothetical protein